ncbi:MAG TPA: DinB family protein, partial [Ktedonobacterales bacterium]|nr:DinB family protein [Ktedonobacterales bacterium]
KEGITMADSSHVTRETSGETEPREPSRLSRRNALKAGATGMASMAGMAWALTIGHDGADLVKELAHLAQGRPMTATRLADILRTERAQWNALLAQVGPNRMEIPGVEGVWSVKELVAHLTWYERAVVDGAAQIMNTGTFTRPNDGRGMDERNVRIAAESRARPTDEVLAEADDVFAQLLKVIAACPDDLLNNAKLLGLPDDVPPWMRVANNSYLHYQQHEQSIRAWLAHQETCARI